MSIDIFLVSEVHFLGKGDRPLIKPVIVTDEAGLPTQIACVNALKRDEAKLAVFRLTEVGKDELLAILKRNAGGNQS